MSYAIRYGPQKTKEPPKDNRNSLYFFGIFLIAVLVAVGFFWPQGMETLRMILFPWADGPTLSAFREMLIQIGEGSSVSDALFVFCQEVISNAGLLS